mgnify:CR=1 FL=1
MLACARQHLHAWGRAGSRSPVEDLDHERAARVLRHEWRWPAPAHVAYGRRRGAGNLSCPDGPPGEVEEDVLEAAPFDGQIGGQHVVARAPGRDLCEELRVTAAATTYRPGVGSVTVTSGPSAARSDGRSKPGGSAEAHLAGRGAGELGGCAGGDDPALVDDDDTVGQPFGLVQEVRGEHHR